MRKEREITGKDLEEILKLESNDVCVTLFRNYFARISPTKDPRFLVNDYFMLPKERFGTAKEGYTTIGIYICNLHIVLPRFKHIFGYLNKPFDGDTVEWFEDKISTALMEDKITTDDFKDYLNRVQWLGGNKIMTLFTPSLTSALLKPVPGLEDKKRELFAENKEAVEAGDATVGVKIEKELIKFATDNLKKDEGFENFESKAKINIGNNYKTMQIMKGPLASNVDGKYQINQSNYNSGVSKEEYSSFADSAVFGAYSRALGVTEGGYTSNKMNQSLGAVKAGPRGSDCGTKECLKVTLFPSMLDKYVNRYIVEGGKIVKLTSENIKSYAGKTVDMRSPMFCHMAEPCYCNICVGDQPYIMNIQNYGLAINRAANKLLNLKLKKFHDMTIKTKEIDINSLFKFKN